MPQYEDVYEPPILDSTGQAIANAIQGLNPTVPSFISDAFSVERNYSKGDICIYDNKVYEFTSAKSAGAWDSTKVTQTTIGAVCTSLSNSLTQLELFTGQLVNHNITNYLIGTVLFDGGANPDCTLKIQIGKLDNSNNYIQFFVNDVDYGYVKFDTSRNIGVIA